ncbi:MAG: mechanosensitive ion channel family protein [Lachnospiraceae bacterium]
MMTTLEVQDISLLENYLRGLVPSLISFALSVIGAVLVYLIGVRVIRWIRRLFKKMLTRHNVDEGVCQFLDAIVKVAGYFVLILMILGFFGVTTASVVAVLGSAGLTLGLALQGSLSNFAGGVLILLLKPFTVGDYIIEESGKKEGTVQEISIFYTTLMTADQKTVVVPNGTLANNSITNLTKSGRRRLDVRVGVAYNADIRRAKQVLQQVAEQSTHRLLSEAPVILVDELADSSVNLIVRVWTDSEEYWDERWELTEQIKLALDEAEIEIAFPQLDVHVR